jgi:hypothetical protein
VGGSSGPVKEGYMPFFHQSFSIISNNLSNSSGKWMGPDLIIISLKINLFLP